MMYYLAKVFQAAGLAIITIDFMRHFPQVMNRKILTLGILLFGMGWVIQKFLLKP